MAGCGQRTSDRTGRARATTLAAHALCALACACADPVHIRLLEPGTAHDEPSDALPDAGEPTQPNPGGPPDAGPAGQPDARPSGLPDAAQPAAEARLVLRYDFSGTGTRVNDLVGGADAVVMGGAALDGAGGVELDGDNDFVDMPNGILSRHDSATIVAWLDWMGAVENCWQRIFDFGSSWSATPSRRCS
jgi:hypothetical protein